MTLVGDRPKSSDAPLVDGYDAVLLDLDGVVYRGAVAVPGAAPALAAVRQHGSRLAFVTNNASRTPESVADHLVGIGIEARPDEVVTSAQAAAHLVADLIPPGSAVLVVGGAGLEAALAERGLRPVRSLADEPAAVIQGYAPEVDWRQLAEGSYAIERGLPWVAANADLTIPTDRGVAPGNGTLVAAIATATGATPVLAGKPELPLHQEAVARTRSARPLIVGDRLDTDIEGANRAGVDSLLVLTGVTSSAALVAAPQHQRPAYLAADLHGLLVLHPPVTVDPDGRRYLCGDWIVWRERSEIKINGAGEPFDGLRAVCMAAWASSEPISPESVASAVDAVGL